MKLTHTKARASRPDRVDRAISRSPRIRKRKDEDMTLIKDMTYTKTSPKTDKQIQLDVLAEIARDFRFKPAELGVEVDAGVVTLTGTVTSYPTLALAAEIAGNVPSVKDVANKLTVEIAPHAVRDDTRIAQAVRNALEWDVTPPRPHGQRSGRRPGPSTHAPCPPRR